MTIRLSKEFCDGMYFPFCTKGTKVAYKNVKTKDTIREAWKNTGRYLNELSKENDIENRIGGLEPPVLLIE